MPFDLNLAAERNIDPVAKTPKYDALLANLQGNILKGHGRERSAHVFLRFLPVDRMILAAGLAGLAKNVTTMAVQLRDTRRFKDFGVPGGVFTTIALAATAYRKLGLPLPSNDPLFGAGMVNAGPTLGDPPTQLADGFKAGGIDAVLMLADDDEDYLMAEVRKVLDALEPATATATTASVPAWATVATVSIGRALRNEAGEGIEPFGFVDGRSQPLYLLSDVCDEIDARTGANITNYDPSEPLSRVLVPDPLVPAATDACGSLMVFRKLEQNVQGFRMKEQELANKLGLVGPDRARAGAMVVGRFQDGTPLALAQTDGLVPAKDNNFTFLGDPDGLKCPFQAHVRKVNPRGDFAGDVNAESERGRRITRRGIAYDDRPTTPTGRQTLEELPTGGVGLLFVCYQSSIKDQFAFMQIAWANNVGFARLGAGIDPIIGQVANAPDQSWHPAYNGSNPTPPVLAGCPVGQASPSPVSAGFSGFVKMLGGEFFFAPSVAFLRTVVQIVAAPPPPVVPVQPPTPPVTPGPLYRGSPMAPGW